MNGEALAGPHVYNGEIVWDGKNGEGVDTVSGVYIIKYKAEYIDGSKTREETWKQGVIR